MLVASRLIPALILVFIVFPGQLPGSAVAGTNAPANGSAPAPASEAAVLPESLTAEEAQKLLAPMPDKEVRRLLLLEMEASRGKEKKEKDFIGRMEASTQRVQQSFRQMVAAIPELPNIPADLWYQVSDGGLTPGWKLLYEFVLSLLAGWLLEKAYRRLVWNPRKLAASIFTPSLSFGSRLGFVGLSGLMELVAIGVFALGAVLTGAFLITSDAPQILVVSLLWSIVAVRALTLLVNLVLAPKEPRFRLAALDDAAAKTGARWASLLIVAWVGMNWIFYMMREYAIPPGPVMLVSLFSSLLFVALLIAIVLKAREPVARRIYSEGEETGEVSTLRQFFAQKWHILAIVYILAILLFSMLVDLASGGEGAGGRGIVSVLILFAIPVADAALRNLIKVLFKPEETEEDEAFVETSDVKVGADGEIHIVPAEPKPRKKILTGYERMAINYGRMLLGMGVFLLLMEVWDVNLKGLTEQMVGARLASVVFQIAIIWLVAYVIWGLTKTAIAQKIGEDAGQIGVMPGEDEPGAGVGKTRLQTLLPLFQKFVFISLGVMVTMVSLSALGVNIGPLIAGAGVVGIAIGFGAQKLVQDVVSGIFFLIDDAFRVGEYIEAGGMKGTVEKISIRSLRLRHHLGPVQTIPFSEIKAVKNHSRDFVIMKLKFRVPFDTDIEKVRKIIKKVGREMLKDPELGPDFLGPLKSQGVLSVEDDALLMRMKFTAKPGRQWMIRREAYRRVKEALEKEGIEFANKQVTVHIPEAEGGPLTEEQKRRIAGSAAQVAIEKEQAEEEGGEEPR